MDRCPSEITWRAHVDKITGKVSKWLGILRRIKAVLNKDILCTIYKTTIGP